VFDGRENRWLRRQFYRAAAASGQHHEQSGDSKKPRAYAPVFAQFNFLTRSEFSRSSLGNRD
jgi:hypothetical protein